MNPYGGEILEKYIRSDKEGIGLIKTFLGVEEKEILFSFRKIVGLAKFLCYKSIPECVPIPLLMRLN